MPDNQKSLSQTTPCIGNDPACPCQDGDACHYRDTADSPGWTLPKVEQIAIALWQRFAPGFSVEWADETHAAEYRNAAQKVLEIAYDGWTCGALRQGTAGGGDPADCNWPICGCDLYASKILDAMDEMGALNLPEPGK